MQHILRIADHTVPKKVLQAYEKQGEKIGISWYIIALKNPKQKIPVSLLQRFFFPRMPIY